MHSIENAKSIIGFLESKARENGMSVSLGGSVIHKGHSNNDIDLIVFNLKTSIKPNHEKFIKDILSEYAINMLGCVDHSGFGDEKLVYKFKTTEGIRIDILFVNLLFKDRIPDVKILKRKNK